ncbi:MULTISPECIES: LacI family DNA-binding transcriptional regulator [unclassified Virgibacillus]|uniref:LacI family DNA-binding transcriptional regulator n=1 Tax=unclassified Virgibacillus TaxID=2620237 RepID=UPI00090ACD10|nr:MULTISPECIES: substrate-binding domain-containing protein [unclassified Virgibacillus]API92628.1 LacI family transcriptional regulator [Virgibacillus sp. 6R]MBS7428119.1 substrate-binding domain-containing protein [Virgibacillus sp. 19R1-5]
MKKSTIKDVAREANVSIATVSRILNNTGKGYSDKTRQHVMQTIERMGYFPNAIARGLINNESGTIGVLFPVVSGMVSAELLHGIEAAAQAFDKSVIVCNTLSDPDKTEHYLQLLYEKQVEGVIFANARLTSDFQKMVKQMAVPFVTLAGTSEIEGIPEVKVNDQQASYDATQYLIKHGHSQLAMVSGPSHDLIAGTPRIEGFKQALADANLPCKATQISWSHAFNFEDGKHAFRSIMAHHPETTAIFAASDEMAAGVISEAHAQGIRVPDDLSIIGYDNTKLAMMTVPALTTVSQEFDTMGNRAAELLCHSIMGEDIESLSLKHKIVERESVNKQ